MTASVVAITDVSAELPAPTAYQYCLIDSLNRFVTVAGCDLPIVDKTIGGLIAAVEYNAGVTLFHTPGTATLSTNGILAGSGGEVVCPVVYRVAHIQTASWIGLWSDLDRRDEIELGLTPSPSPDWSSVPSRLTGATWEYRIGDYVGRVYFSDRRGKYVGVVQANHDGVLLDAGRQPDPSESLSQLQGAVLDGIAALLKG